MIYDSSNDNHWQFVEAMCNGTSANYVDTHVFSLYHPNSTTIKYECLLCGKQLNTPEYDDRNILDDADYMIVYTLQQLSEYEFAKGDYLKFEGCLKTIDKIRQRDEYKQNGISKYQYRNSAGVYVTPNDYEYTSSNVRLEISTNQITIGGFVLNSLFRALLNQVGELIPEPYDQLGSIYSDFMTLNDVVELLGKK